ncbi:transcriptional regulator [Serinibacter arcticus]|uniref:Transcriptional regulator n=1 Tax=Serinibacter arcticus TaxID=1655435 RepID=A0A2U1ZUW0_9MICO|nr:GAF and ANTAR domain-containing protein [Serinibacter arcticus]PWD50775.1 transcriptional regulator [Serinibacter arcticus]
MTSRTRERDLVDTFVTLSDTLVADYDVVDLVQVLVDRTATIFRAASVGLLLADPDGTVEVLASTDERAQLIELIQLRANAGPCMECYRSGEPVEVPDVLLAGPEREELRTAMVSLDLRAVHSVPMHLREQTIGSLNLFHSDPGPLDPDDLAVVQALADVATIGILHQRALVESDTVRTQLQRALDSRIVIEQAKGAVAYAHDLRVDEAFDRIRSYARANRLQISAVAQRIVAFELEV